jgi:protein-tyrosine-phosphatase/predicted phosphodiesterase
MTEAMALASRVLRVLFLCTQNSARSQIAEALLQRKGQGRFEVASAGTDPAPQVHPMAVRVLGEDGIDWQGNRPKSLPVVWDEPWDFIITFCDKARETCPTFPGKPIFAHWGIEDPAAIEGEEAVRYRAFSDTLAYLSRRIDLMLALPFERLERRAAEERVRAIGREDATRAGALGTALDLKPYISSNGGTPMRYALISDIHANLPALQAVLDHIANRPEIDATYHLGDLVGYAPWPNETVALLKGFRIQGIAGNYDSTVAADYKHCGCKYEDPRQEELSHLSFEWTKQHCSAETRRFLAQLSFRLDIRPNGGHQPGPTVVLVHGTPTLNTLYWTEDRPDSFCLKMAEMAGARKGDVICFGHTHKPWDREVEGIHFVNTGSVGRPKDGDWRAGYVVLDVGGDRPGVEFIRVEYDLQQAMDAIRKSDLPDDFAEYLATGGIPKPASAVADAG